MFNRLIPDRIIHRNIVDSLFFVFHSLFKEEIMWLFTTVGFFSVVQKPGNSFLTVRSRVKDDLINLKEKYMPGLSDIAAHAGTDYPYRATIGHEDFASGLAEMARDIHYSNFKSEVAKTAGYERENLYSKVWDVVQGLEKLPKKKPVTVSPMPKSHKKLSYGGVVINGQGKVLLMEPKNHFGGYVWTFPKGRPHADEAPETTALREVEEETGVKVEILTPIPGVFEGTITENRYYLMSPASGEGKPGKEAQSIAWAKYEEAQYLIHQTTNSVGQERDLQILDAGFKAWGEIPGTLLDRYKGCMFGGAVGDALGAPVEFMKLAEIRSVFGKQGIADFAKAYGRKGAITDDTQMSLFTAEGLLRACVRGREKGICHGPSVVHHAYVRWLNTQGEKSKSAFNGTKDGLLIGISELHSRRAPGNSCLSALRAKEMGTMETPINNSKGCGAVMRAAPVGLVMEDPQSVFDMGCEIGAVTHGHPTGYLAAGHLAAIIHKVVSGIRIGSAINETRDLLKARPHHEECLRAVELAENLSKTSTPSPEVIEKMGSGWTAEEALGISLYCAMVAEGDFSRGVLLAVNHSGDSDSTGAITGNILGAQLGKSAIPDHWLKQLELRELIEEVSYDLFVKYTDLWGEKKYPGW